MRGYDAGKKISGRKRNVLVDTLGLVLLVAVTAANVQDRNGARTLLLPLTQSVPPFAADLGRWRLSGKLEPWIRGLRKWGKLRLDIVQKGFSVLPWRWMVERTFCLARPLSTPEM